MKKQIVIFGTGEIAELAHFYFKNDKSYPYEVVAFTADDQFITASTFFDLPLLPLSKLKNVYPPDKFGAHVALSYSKLNKIREQKYHLLKDMGYELVSYVCSNSVTWPDLDIGDNCFILENQTIQPTVKVGNNVMIWSGNHLGHGCQIDDHTYISSHVCISGHVKIGQRCFLGVNSAFADFTEIGNDCFVGMGANVVNDLPDGAMILCAKSNIFDKEHDLTKKIMKSYFGVQECGIKEGCC